MSRDSVLVVVFDDRRGASRMLVLAPRERETEEKRRDADRLIGFGRAASWSWMSLDCVFTDVNVYHESVSNGPGGLGINKVRETAVTRIVAQMVKLKVAFPKSDTRNTRPGSMLFPAVTVPCLPQRPPLVLITCSLPACALLITFWGRKPALHCTSIQPKSSVAARDHRAALVFLCTDRTANNNTNKSQSLIPF